MLYGWTKTGDRLVRPILLTGKRIGWIDSTGILFTARGRYIPHRSVEISRRVLIGLLARTNWLF